MWESEASVARERVAEGCGWWRGTAEASEDLAARKDECILGVKQWHLSRA